MSIFQIIRFPVKEKLKENLEKVIVGEISEYNIEEYLREVSVSFSSLTNSGFTVKHNENRLYIDYIIKKENTTTPCTSRNLQEFEKMVLNIIKDYLPIIIDADCFYIEEAA